MVKIVGRIDSPLDPVAPVQGCGQKIHPEWAIFGESCKNVLIANQIHSQFSDSKNSSSVVYQSHMSFMF